MLLTIYFAVAADVNVGVITTIWSITPFFLALADYLLFNVRLGSHHYIGITLIVISTILISLIKVIDPDFVKSTEVVKTVPTIIPVCFGLFTPVFFTIFGMTIKHLTQERIGFITWNLSFNSILVMNTIMLIIVLPYWNAGHFDKRLFWLGFFGSIIDTLGKVCS